MKSKRNGLLWTVIALLIIALAAAAFYGKQAQRSAAVAPDGRAELGGRAPQFVALTTGGLFDLNAAKRPVFLEIFATWCPHCRRETSVIDKLYEAYKDRVAFVGVSGSNVGMDGRSDSSEEDVVTFAQQFNVRYPIAYDGSLTVAHQYLYGGFPTLVVIDRKKIIQYINRGEVPYDELSAAIQRALK